MSTEIKNTLFRFVSMRAPELTDQTKPMEGFVIRDEAVVKGAFDTAIAGMREGDTKWQTLKTAAASFSPTSKEDIEKINDKLYAFSIWVAKNRNFFTPSELAKASEGVEAIKDTETLGRLWDNLFYQIVTQSDFYAKEAIIQVLIANHFIGNYKGEDIDMAKALLGAKVVLPKVLFVEGEVQAKAAEKKALSNKGKYPSVEMTKLQALTQAELYNEELAVLSRELKRAKKAYQSSYKTAFEAAEKDHQKRIQPILDQYEKDVQAENEKWCSIKDAGVEYDPNDPCNRPKVVPKPVMPEFEFSFQKELDYEFLASKLSEESLEVLSDILAGHAGASIEKSARVSQEDFGVYTDDFVGYADLEDHIEDIVSDNNQVIADNTEDEEDTLVSIGGVVVPVGTSGSSEVFSYQICPKLKKRFPYFARKYNANMSIVLPDASWSVVNFDYTLERTDNNYSNNGEQTYTLLKLGNRLFINNINIGNPTLLEDSQIVGLRGTITFANGVEKTFDIPGFNLRQCNIGVLEGEVATDDNDDNTTGVPQEMPFVPSGFGVKQLGIADYNKVEQTTQGYIEGDVAHIENIMAREFKERSTRRLRRKEETLTTSSESEREQLTDTTSTQRFEMQNEVAKVIQDIKDFSAGANFNASYKMGANASIQLGANANYATHNSKEESTLQAITNAKDITERALDRLVTKVKEERVEKIVEEFEENNSHGFDNRKGDKHVVGVFRWVDKIFKNQVINYGKRLMFEFMVPQPAKLHVLGMSENKNSGDTILTPPTDPRLSTMHKLDNYSKINDTTLKYWAAKYNVEISPKPKGSLSVSKGFDGNYTSTGYYTTGRGEIIIPEGYEVNRAKASLSFDFHPGGMEASGVTINIGDKMFNRQWFTHFNEEEIYFENLGGIQQSLGVAYKAFDCGTFSMSVVAECSLTTETEKQWQLEAYKAIIDAYEAALAKFEEDLKIEKELGIQIKGTNPGFYREFENKILRKNCISYLIDQNTDALNTYGKSNMYRKNDGSNDFTFGNTEINVNQSLDNYAAFVKFMEQAFEWDIMSYNLYPYYWGDRQDWASLYSYDETTDPLFRNFMQAGMARVVITVRPGFEEAVRYYMQTGQIWNGGEVPVIEDELYLSLVDELRQPKGEKLGKAWPTRVPTPLTILQAQSIGLKVTKALPYNEDLSDFENPDEVPQSDQLELTDAELGSTSVVATARLGGKIGGSEGITSKILLKRVDGFIQDLTYCDINGTWELNNLPAGRYELLLDADDDFPSDQFAVMEGSKEQVVELEDGQTIEINLEVKKL